MEGEVTAKSIEVGVLYVEWIKVVCFDELSHQNGLWKSDRIKQ